MSARLEKVSYLCESCGAIATKWAGQCVQCESWNSLREQVVTDRRSFASPDNNQTMPKRMILSSVKANEAIRVSSGLAELDRVLGGGVVEGSAILLGGDPGIGKSTLALQSICHLQSSREVLYVTGEESVEQLALRAKRLGIDGAGIHVFAGNEVQAVIRHARELDAKFLVADSIQTLFHESIQSAPGTSSQVRECALSLVAFAKQTGCSVLLIGHVTKEGGIAGPKLLEHLVDTVLYFEGDHSSRFRLVRAFKNRFGTVNEIGVFAMTETGLREVANPSSMFLSRGQNEASGSVVFASQEATRPLLVEVQALVDDSHLANPRRICVGFDPRRLAMVLAVLNRHLGLAIVERDIFINVAGGIRLSETAADLAIAAALYSSAIGRAIAAHTVFFGEVSLSGDVRPVPWGESRLQEAANLGFQCAVIPARNKLGKLPSVLEVVEIESLNGLIQWIDACSQPAS